MKVRWAAIGLFLFLCALTLNRFSDRFSYSYEVIEQPALWLVAGLVTALTLSGAVAALLA